MTRWPARSAWMVLALGLALGLVVRADDDTTPLSITKLDTPDGFALWAENRQGAELTITVEGGPNFTNVVSDPPLPVTLTVGGGERVQLCRLHRAEPTLGWNADYRWFWTWGPLDANHDDNYSYQLPFQGRYRVSQGYNGRFSHTGDSRYAIDFDVPVGTPVLACREGTVVATEANYDQGGPSRYYRNRVNKVVVKQPDGTLAEYDHLRFHGVTVQVGEHLEPGTLIGYSGATGFVSGPHLHFMVYKALDGKQRQSFPTKFSVKGSAEPVQLEQGRFYASP